MTSSAWMSPRGWLLTGLVGIPVAAGVACGLLYVGLVPKRVIVCNMQSDFEARIFGDRLGHVDGADFTGCLTPSLWGYVVAVLAAFVTLVLVALMFAEPNDRWVPSQRGRRRAPALRPGGFAPIRPSHGRLFEPGSQCVLS